MKQEFERARTTLGDGPGPARRALQRTRLLNAGKPSRARRKVLIPALGVAVAALCLWFATRDREDVRPGEVLSAGMSARVVEFSHGTRVTLAPGAVAHVESLDDQHVDFVLSSGRFAAEVTKGTGRVWQYEAGPWVVRVVGTKLQVSWSPAAQALEVEVSEGVVEVGRSGEPPTLVRAGETLRRAPVAEVKGSPTSSPEPELAEAPPKPTKRAVVRDVSPTVAVPAPSAPTWQQLMASGHRREALEQAEAEGVLRQVAHVRNDDALLLADAARLERRVGLARELFAHVTTRGGPDAAEAAFLLGRLEAEAHAADAARRAFTQSIELSSSGPFSEQARGRLLELLLEQQDLKPARRVAREYLSLHPSGAWSNLAKKVAAP